VHYHAVRLDADKEETVGVVRVAGWRVCLVLALVDESASRLERVWNRRYCLDPEVRSHHRQIGRQVPFVRRAESGSRHVRIEAKDGVAADGVHVVVRVVQLPQSSPGSPPFDSTSLILTTTLQSYGERSFGDPDESSFGDDVIDVEDDSLSVDDDVLSVDDDELTLE
jgi:hypothetical protein